MVTTKQLCILVVEDEDRIASLLQRQFETAGFEVLTASNGSAALNYIETRVPDLVVLDLRLPDISGYELCWKLRRLYDRARLPIVIVTGVEQCMEDLRREAAGANAYLRKPYDPEELLRLVRFLVKEADK